MINRPCARCPFRTDIHPYLNEERAEEISDSLRAGAEFPCHATLDYETDDMEPERADRTSFCAGAMIVLEQSEGPNQMMRIAARLGFYDYTKLDMDAPVFEDPDDFVGAQARG